MVLKTHFVLAVATIFILPIQAMAAVTAIEALQVPQTDLPSYVASDLLIDFTGDLQVQQLVVELEAGDIFQCDDGFPIEPPFPSPIPDCMLDTRVGWGEITATSPSILVAGGAVHIDPNAMLKFDEEGINIAWGSADVVSNGDEFFIARITLSNDAQGTINYLGNTAADSGEPFRANGIIRDGVITFVPEPASSMLAACIAVAAVGCSRRRYFSRAILRYSS